MTKTILSAQHLSKKVSSTEDQLSILDNVSFELAQGDSLAIIGRSGSGKSTLLGLLAGLDLPSSGEVILAGHNLNTLDEDQRAAIRAEHVGFVFQAFLLLDSLNALENVMLPLELAGHANPQQRASELLIRVGLEKRLQHPVNLLSGGEQQRVALARAFATQPELLLMDEPFGALDALTRGVIQDELVNIVEETHQTVFMITHDIDEAILLADRIFLMSNGPRAFLAEIVENTIPKPRHRDNIHHHGHYYKIRNHLLDFLVHRSKALQQSAERPTAPKVINFDNEAWSI